MQKKIVFRCGSVYIRGMIYFVWPWMIGLIVLPLVVRWWGRRSDNRQVVGVGGALRVPFFGALAAFGQPMGKTSVTGIRRALWMSWLCLVIACMRPVVYTGDAGIPQEARHIMLAIDVSGSMAQQDFDVAGRPVTRLAMVRDVVSDFVRQRVGDRLGLVVFGSEAHVLAPLSRDRKALADLFADVGIGIAGEQTAIGDALARSVEATAAVPSDHKVIILLSDGYNNAGVVSVAQAVELAKKQGITVYTVGIGSDRQTVQGFFGSMTVDPSVDLDEALLTQVAEATGGRYFRAKSAADLRAIYDIINKLEALPDTDLVARPRRDIFWVPVLVGLVFVFGIAVHRGRQG